MKPVQMMVRVPKAVVPAVQDLRWAELLAKAERGENGIAIVDEINPVMVGRSEPPLPGWYKTDEAHKEARLEWESSQGCSFFREGESYDSWTAGRSLLFFQNW
jgi:hypothetical protein